MSREFPDWVNPRAAAEGRRIYSGTLPLSRLKRLGGLLTRVDGEAEFRASFSMDGEQRPVIEIEVRAELPLVCQVSLEEYPECVVRKTLLGVIESEAEAESLPGHYEPVRTEHGRLALADLVEDELLLGMPNIPRRPGLEAVTHHAGDPPAGEASEEELQKPFAQLGELMRKRPDRRETD